MAMTNRAWLRGRTGRILSVRMGRSARLRCLVAGIVVAFSASCASRPFDVRVLPTVQPDTISAPVSAGSLEVRAAPMWDEDWLLANFDANTVLAGVLPVRAQLSNTGAEPIALKKVRFTIRTDAGGAVQLVDGKKARKLIENYYGLSFRSASGEKLYKQDFAANVLDVKSPLAPGEGRQGFLFVRLPANDSRRIPLVLGVRVKASGESADLQLK